MKTAREMVRAALKQGHNDFAGAFEFIKRSYNYEMSAQQYSQNRRLIIAEDPYVQHEQPTPTPEVALSGLELARILKTMVKTAGIEKVRETLDIVDLLSK